MQSSWDRSKLWSLGINTGVEVGDGNGEEPPLGWAHRHEGEICLMGIAQVKCFAVPHAAPTPRYKESSVKPQYSQMFGMPKFHKGAEVWNKADKGPTLSWLLETSVSPHLGFKSINSITVKLIMLIGQNLLDHQCWAHGILIETYWTEACWVLPAKAAFCAPIYIVQYPL